MFSAWYSQSEMIIFCRISLEKAVQDLENTLMLHRGEILVNIFVKQVILVLRYLLAC